MGFMRLDRSSTALHVCWYRWGVLGLLVGLLGLGVRPAAAQAERPCEDAFEAAEAAYLDADFEGAVRLLSPCLDRDDVPEERAVQAYRLLSLAHLRQDELSAARAAIVNILSLRPGYEADPVEDPPSYVSLVSIVRRDVQPAELAEGEGEAEEARPTPFFRRTSTWLSIAGSVLVTGAVAFVTLGPGGGGDDDGGGNGGGSEPLPAPPGTPSGYE